MSAIARKCNPQSEVTSINKQRFLAELGKLLTFMYEEDRLRALEMYSRMFDEAGDEGALIQSLLSPTRQAVVIARAYHSNLAQITVTTESKAAPEDRDENGVPDYVQAIEAVRADAFARQPAPAVNAEAEEPAPAPAVNAEAEEPAPAPEESAEAEEPAPAPEESTEAEEPAPAAEESAEAEEPAPAPEESAEAEEPAPAPEKSAEAEEPVPAENKTNENIQFFSMPEEGAEEEAGETQREESAFNIDTDLMRQPRRKAKVFALIVYILFAIPITLAAIAILLVPAVLFLALSVAAIICGVVVVSAAFNGFAVIADIMVVLGGALVLFALGLLFLWTAIWFVGGAIVGVVHGVAALCDKWCYKEVLD